MSWLIDTGHKMISTYADLVTWLSTEFAIGTWTFVVGDLLFGSGLIVFLGYVVISFVIDILP